MKEHKDYYFELKEKFGAEFPLEMILANADDLLEHIKKAQQLCAELDKEFKHIQEFRAELRLHEARRRE